MGDSSVSRDETGIVSEEALILIKLVPGFFFFFFTDRILLAAFILFL